MHDCMNLLRTPSAFNFTIEISGVSNFRREVFIMQKKRIKELLDRRN